MAHQSPLISLPRKTTSDTDWAGPIRSTIAHVYGESPDSYAEEISVLQRCRQDAVRGAGSDTTARDLLYKYFGQLELLELRFSDAKVSFGWNDAFTGKLTTQTSLAFEKASIIHLLASVLSSLAAQQSRADPEGLKRAYFNCRATAGMLTYINENFLHAPSTDLSREVIHFLISLMQAQATEVFLEKLVEEKKAAGLVARAANQVAGMYSSLAEDAREIINKGILDHLWVSLIQTKAKHFASVAQYQRAKGDDAAGKHGVALVRFKNADSLAQEAQRMAKGFSYSFEGSSTNTFPHDAGSCLVEITKSHAQVCAEAKSQSIKNNDLIYHDILPSEASLPAIEKLPAAAPVTIQEVYTNPDVSKLIGPDIFIRLVPLSVHESASVYSEEKAKITRAESERVELSEAEIRAALDHMRLPAAVSRWRQMADGDDLDADQEVSSAVIQIANTISQAGATESQVQQLETERIRRERELQELSSLLDNESRECERARAKYVPNFTQPPSGPQTTHLRSNLTSNLGSISSAAASDAQIIRMWQDIQPELRDLKLGADGLNARAKDVALGNDKPSPEVPSGMSLLDLQDEEQVRPQIDSREQEELRQAATDATEKLDRLQKIRRERDEVLKDFKEKVQNDDVSNLLLLNRRTQNVEPQLFATELEKFRPYQSRIAAAVQASKGIVTELEAIVSRVDHLKGVRERQRSSKGNAKRLHDWESRLERAGATHAEVVSGLSKALAFYESMDKVIGDLKKEIQTFVASRDNERRRIVSDLETRNRLSSSPPPVTSAPRGIESQFGNLNIRSPASPSASSSAYPPPPARPSDPYDFGNLSSLPSAFSSSPASTTRPPPPPLPASRPGTQQQQSYSSNYPAYPSFPSPPRGAPAPPTAPSPSTANPYQAQPSYQPPSNSYPGPPSPYSPLTSSSPSAFPPPPPSRPTHPYGAQPSSYPAPPQQQYGSPSQQQYGQRVSQTYGGPPPQQPPYPTPPSQLSQASYSYSQPTPVSGHSSGQYPPYPPPPSQSGFQPQQQQYPGYQPPSSGYRGY